MWSLRSRSVTTSTSNLLIQLCAQPLRPLRLRGELGSIRNQAETQTRKRTDRITVSNKQRFLSDWIGFNYVLLCLSHAGLNPSAT